MEKILPYLGLEKSGPDVSLIPIPVELKEIAFIYRSKCISISFKMSQIKIKTNLK